MFLKKIDYFNQYSSVYTKLGCFHLDFTFENIRLKLAIPLALNQAINTILSNCAGQFTVLDVMLTLTKWFHGIPDKVVYRKPHQITLLMLKLMSLPPKITRLIFDRAALHFLTSAFFTFNVMLPHFHEKS